MKQCEVSVQSIMCIQMEAFPKLVKILSKTWQIGATCAYIKSIKRLEYEYKTEMPLLSVN